MNVEGSFVIPEDIFSSVVSLIWSMGGYVCATGHNISIMAEDERFYSIRDKVAKMIDEQHNTEPTDEYNTDM